MMLQHLVIQFLLSYYLTSEENFKPLELKVVSDAYKGWLLTGCSKIYGDLTGKLSVY